MAPVIEMETGQSLRTAWRRPLQRYPMLLTRRDLSELDHEMQQTGICSLPRTMWDEPSLIDFDYWAGVNNRLRRAGKFMAQQGLYPTLHDS
jgi:hypothetical protein